MCFRLSHMGVKQLQLLPAETVLLGQGLGELVDVAVVALVVLQQPDQALQRAGQPVVGVAAVLVQGQLVCQRLVELAAELLAQQRLVVLQPRGLLLRGLL